MPHLPGVHTEWPIIGFPRSAERFIPRTEVATDVDTSETTTSTNPADLATVGPTLTINVGPRGILKVHLYCALVNSGANGSRMSFALSGANTVSAALDNSISNRGTDTRRIGATICLTGLNPGSTTVTAKYWVTAGTGTFSDRKMFCETE
jgi:hypothetical protein